MVKKFLNLILLTLAICVNCASATSALSSHQADNKLTIKIENNVFTAALPLHDFYYDMTIPADETYIGDMLAGLLPPHVTISTDLYRMNGDKNIEVDIKISDPVLEARLVWKGKVIYDRLHHIVESTSDFLDPRYAVKIKLTQPDQGSPEFFMKVMSH